MVRYRPETRERGYTFRLANGNGTDSNGISPTGTLMSDHSASTLDSSVYKERIDSLFRQEQLQRHNANLANRRPLIEEEDDNNAAVDEPTMEHLQLHFQKVLAEQRSTSGSVASSKLQSTTYIQVNNHANQSNRDSAENRAQRFNEARNAVQAKIEKMFQDATAGNNNNNNNQKQTKAIVHHAHTSETNAPVINISNNKAVINVRSEHPPPPPAKSHNKQNVPLPPIPVSTPPPPPVAESTNTNQYNVDYLGSLSLPGRATSLESLQFPLKELYSKYRQQANGTYQGAMEISPAGLRIKYQSGNRRTQEILNPFPTIAVWAAVKFVARSESGGRRFAFLPLICDPENQDKQSLFHPLNDDGDWVTTPAFHPPLFTCVMRNTQAPKNLECHAFVCENPEDAIVIAANLYQALLRNMKNNDAQKAEQQETQKNGHHQSEQIEHARPAHNARKPAPIPEMPPAVPAAREPIYSPSSISNWSESSVSSCVQTPVRPPRRKKSSKTQDGAGLERRKSVRRSQNKNRASQGKANLRRSMRTASQRSNGRVKRSVSERQLGEMLASADVLDKSADHNNGGDILTKVAIPRSKSFMTVPQQNYSIAELFEELKKQEGIKSVDDVLKMIVNRDRMSFNELAPAYKELLMKLALTLSKDEMFQRSKNIMRLQTGKNNKSKAKSPSNSRPKSADSEAEHSTSSSRISSVLRATKKSFSKWGASRSASNGYSVSKDDKQSSEPQLLKNAKLKISEPLMLPVAPPIVLPTAATKQFNSHKTPLPPRAVVAKNVLNKTNDYAPSCSECGYDSESCSHKCYCSLSDTQSQDATDYSDGEKCYCSLKRISKSSGAPVYRIRLDSDDTDTSHDSLQESVTKSSHLKPTKNKQNYARKSASMTSWSALSGAESPLTAWRRNTANLQHSAPATTKSSVPSISNRFTVSSASSLRQKSLSSYLSDTSLDSDVVAMTEPAQPMKTFGKEAEIIRRKSRSSYTVSETELDTTSCNSFVRGPVLPPGQQPRKTSPAESMGYQSYDSTGSSGRTSRNYSLENLSSAEDGRRNSNSSSDKSMKSHSSARGNKFLMVSAVDPKGKLVYRGASSAGSSHRGSKVAPEGALAAKKTTEIAAMFSNIKLNQTTDIVIDESEATEDTASEISTDDAYSSMHFRANRNNKNGFSKSMENSLGYLP